MAIVELTDFQHIWSRPEMYVGNTQDPTHLLYELIDNAADEVINGKANELRVYLDYDSHRYSVSDNGRGIPIKEKGIKNDVPIVIATTLHSGGKFDNELYNYHSGLHGMGLAIVNALSDILEINVVKGRTHYHYEFHKNENQEEAKKLRVIEPVKDQKYSTYESFIPTESMFDSLDIDESVIVDRIKGILISVDKPLNAYLTITRNGVTTETKIENTFLDDYIKQCNPITIKLSGTRKDKDGNEYTDMMTAYIGFEETYKYSKFFSVVNTLPIVDGNHKRFLESGIKDFMWEYAQKTNRSVKREDMLLGSNIFCILTLSDPAFSSQDKRSLTGKTGKYSHLLDKDKLFKQLKKNTEFLDRWLTYCETFRISKDTKDNATPVKKAKNRIAVEGLRDCSSDNVSERELYIVEGQSAGGTLLQARDTSIHAVLPLRGKIINVMESTFTGVLNSKEVTSIVKSVGIALHEADISKLRYGKIVIATDSDNDGFHLRGLLLNFFNKYMTTIIEHRKLYIANLPLYGCNYKGKFTPINNKDELEHYRKLKCDIHRYKGLGEMDADELGECMFNPEVRILTMVEPGEEGMLKYLWDNRIDLIKDFVDKGVKK